MQCGFFRMLRTVILLLYYESPQHAALRIDLKWGLFSSSFYASINGRHSAPNVYEEGSENG